MNLPKEFAFYVERGVARKCSPDKPRAQFLVGESQNSIEGLREIIEKIGANEKNANSIVKDCYDIIMELIRARMLIDGFNASGQYAHESEVSYLQKLGFPDNEVAFLNELGYFRNSITYYGKILDKEYAEKIVKFMNDVYPKLKKLIKV